MGEYRATLEASLSKVNSPTGEKGFKDEQASKKERRVNEKLLRDTNVQVQTEYHPLPSGGSQPQQTNMESKAGQDVEEKLIRSFQNYEEVPELFWDEDDFQLWLETENADIYIDSIIDRGFFSPSDAIGLGKYDHLNHEGGRREIYLNNQDGIDSVMRRIFWKNHANTDDWINKHGVRPRRGI